MRILMSQNNLKAPPRLEVRILIGLNAATAKRTDIKIRDITGFWQNRALRAGL